jgi:hypothetical protein
MARPLLHTISSTCSGVCHVSRVTCHVLRGSAAADTQSPTRHTAVGQVRHRCAPVAPPRPRAPTRPANSGAIGHLSGASGLCPRHRKPAASGCRCSPQRTPDTRGYRGAHALLCRPDRQSPPSAGAPSPRSAAREAEGRRLYSRTPIETRIPRRYPPAHSIQRNPRLRP